jgi:hypothetical protein
VTQMLLGHVPAGNAGAALLGPVVRFDPARGKRILQFTDFERESARLLSKGRYLHRLVVVGLLPAHVDLRITWLDPCARRQQAHSVLGVSVRVHS